MYFAQSVLLCDDAEYLSTLFVLPTSVLIESLFSVTNHIWTN
jgi:hypothetical protein